MGMWPVIGEVMSDWKIIIDGNAAIIGSGHGWKSEKL